MQAARVREKPIPQSYPASIAMNHDYEPSGQNRHKGARSGNRWLSNLTYGQFNRRELIRALGPSQLQQAGEVMGLREESIAATL